MTTIRHRFRSHKINPKTEILVIGTFNPDTQENIADFFYGRQRNFLWTLIPTAFGKTSLKSKGKDDKLKFIRKYKIDFIDLISEVQVDEEDNYDDDYLDPRVVNWRDVISELEKLKNLNRICFTRKSFSGIPQMKKRVDEIQKYCIANKIQFKCLTTPARPPAYYGADNQADWTNFFQNGNNLK